MILEHCLNMTFCTVSKPNLENCLKMAMEKCLNETIKLCLNRTMENFLS